MEHSLFVQSSPMATPPSISSQTSVFSRLTNWGVQRQCQMPLRFTEWSMAGNSLQDWQLELAHFVCLMIQDKQGIRQVNRQRICHWIQIGAVRTRLVNQQTATLTASGTLPFAFTVRPAQDIVLSVQSHNITGSYNNSGQGDMGACCAEMGLWEANKVATALHPGLYVCMKDDECGSQDGDRFIAPTDCD